MPKFDLPEGTYVDVRFTVSQAYDKVSEKGNVTVAPEATFAEVIGHSESLAKVAMTFGRFGSDRGRLAFFVQPKGLATPAPAKPKAKAPAKPKAKAPAKAAEAPAEAPTDLQAMIAAEIAKALAAMAK
jgi:hypothetical protein